MIFRSRNLLIWLLVLLTCALMPATVPGQSEEEDSRQGQENDPQQKADLPLYAIGRFGESGQATNMHGFYRIAFSPDGQLMACRNNLNLIYLIDVASQEVLFEFQSYEDREWILNFDFSPNSKLLLATSEGTDEKIAVWNTESGQLHAELETDGKSAYFKNDREICVLKKGTLSVYSVDSGKAIDVRKWGETVDQPLAFSRISDLIVSQRKFGRSSFRSHVYDIVKKTVTVLSSPTTIARTVVISEDGNWLAATYNRTKEVQLWDLRNPHQKNQKLVAHTATAQSVCFSPDSRFIATTGWDSDVYLWDVLTGKQLGKLSGHTEHVNSCAFSPNDFLLATGASGRTDSSIIFWNFKALVFPDSAEELGKFEFDELWEQLSSEEPAESFAAVGQLVSNYSDWNGQIVKRLGVEATGSSEAEIREWIAQLDSRRYAVRKAAEEKLKKSRMRAEPILKETLERKDVVLEVRYRVERILKQPVERPKIPRADQVRLHRVIYALELIGSAEAREILQNLADAHAHIDIARDAASSLSRSTERDSR